MSEAVKPGFKQTEVGVIPEEWEVKPLSGMVDILHGFGFKSQYFKSLGKYRLTTPGHFYETGGFRDVGDKQKFYDGPLPDGYLLNEGDLIVAMTEQADGLLGSAALVPIGETYLHNQRLGKIKVVASEVSLTFLYRIFNSNVYRAKVRETAAGTKVKHTSPSKLLEILVPLPPTKTEQEAIAETLSDVDALLSALDRLIAKKRDIKQAAMQGLLTGQTRLSSEWAGKDGYKKTELGVIPEDWKIVRLSELVTTGPKNGYSGRCGKESRGTQTLSLGATTTGCLVLNDDTVKRLDSSINEHSDLYLKPGDVLVQRSNTSDLVGTTAVFDGPAGVYVYPDLMMRMRFRDKATAHWFWRYANSAGGRRFFTSIAAGSSGSMPKISGEKLRRMPLPLPPLSEQRAIVELLSDMDAELSALEQRRDKTHALKQAMMQELLTGRTRLLSPGGSHA